MAAASLVVSLSSCGSSLSWAAKIDNDVSVPIGLYIYSQAANYRNAAQNALLSTSTDLKEQTVEVSGTDTKATDYLDKEAKKTVKSYVGAYLMAKELGQELTEEELESAASNAKSTYETDKDVYEQNGIAQSSVEVYYQDITLKGKLFEAKYGADGTNPVSDDELKEYVKANYATINFIQQYFYNDDGSYMTADEIAKLKKEYEKIQSQAEAGKIKFTDKCKEFSDNATNYKGGYTDSTSRFDPDLEDGAKILNLKTGEFTLIVTDSAIALIQKAKLDTKSLLSESSRPSLVLEYKYDDFIKELVAQAEKSDKVEFNDKAFEKFGSATRDFSELSVSSYY